ncbi:retrovirus-related pol polyprotein from transposon TNT 1-94 [Tanacetum coccineum]
MKCITMDSVKPRVLATGRYAIDVEPIPPHNRNNREVALDYLQIPFKESVETLCEIIEEAKVERPLDSSLAFACLYTKHSQELLEYVIGTCPKDFNPQDKKHDATPLTRKKYIRTDNGTEFVNKDLIAYYERADIFHQNTVPRTPQQNVIVKRRNRTLVEAARTMLIFSKAPMFLWAEAVATACYTQNRSLIHTLHNKTPYELVHDKKPDLTFFRVFGALCYPINDSEDLGKLQPTADIGIFVGYAPSRKGTGPAPTFLMPGQISSGLVPNSVPAAPYVPPTNKELEILFQPMFDEYLETPRTERPDSHAPAVLVPVNSAGTPSSTTIDQDAPSPSHSPSSSALQSPSLNQGCDN